MLGGQYGWTMPSISSLRLYREILREVAGLSPAPLRRKITRNTREAFAHHRSAPGHRLAELHEDGRAVVTVIRWLKTIPEVGVWGGLVSLEAEPPGSLELPPTCLPCTCS